jgi:hypothetical protein
MARIHGGEAEGGRGDRFSVRRPPHVRWAVGHFRFRAFFAFATAAMICAFFSPHVSQRGRTSTAGMDG